MKFKSIVDIFLQREFYYKNESPILSIKRRSNDYPSTNWQIIKRIRIIWLFPQLHSCGLQPVRIKPTAPLRSISSDYKLQPRPTGFRVGRGRWNFRTHNTTQENPSRVINELRFTFPFIALLRPGCRFVLSSLRRCCEYFYPESLAGRLFDSLPDVTQFPARSSNPPSIYVTSSVDSLLLLSLSLTFIPYPQPGRSFSLGPNIHVNPLPLAHDSCLNQLATNVESCDMLHDCSRILVRQCQNHNNKPRVKKSLIYNSRVILWHFE